MPLRFPRPVIPVIAAGLAAVWVAASSAPALADQVRQQEFWLSQLSVSQAWQATQGSGVTVAVLSELARRGEIDPSERVVVLITGDGLKTLDAVRGSFETHEIDASVEAFDAEFAHAVA